MRSQIIPQNLAQLGTINEMLDEKYGKIGTPGRDDFDAKAKAWYESECKRDDAQ